MRDVATASGVSPTTVSFVLNGVTDQKISAATRERVTRAAEELGYVPHGIAKALREGSSRIVLLNLDPLFRGGSAETFIHGLDDELSRHGAVLLVRHGHTTRASLSSVLTSVSPRAVIDLTRLYRPGHEAVDDGGWVDGLAAHTAVQLGHLADAGHTHIAMALPDDPDRSRLAELRLHLATGAATALGLPGPDRLMVPADLTQAATRVDGFLATHGRVTAIAAYDDGVALRVLAALRDLGLPVPGRVAVIGFDDTEYGALSQPPLTTVRMDAESYGRRAARAALGLDTTDVTPSPTRVIARGSA
jgi:DNA-binding LacI/PurR family transcriptional regulator